MNKCETPESFVVRIYRVDAENSRKISGLVQTMDGASPGRSFADIDELGEILQNLLNRPDKQKSHERKR